MTFGEAVANAFIALASGAAASGLLMWLFKEWLSTRLKASIQHEFDRKLEAHKAQLKTEQELAVLGIKTEVAREAAFHSAAHASFGEGQKAAMERKLSAIDRAWSSVLQFKASLSPVLTFMDVMTVDEYKGAKSHPMFRELTGDLSPDKLARLAPQGLEEVRPYIGEYMWALVFCYQAIMTRILFLLHLGRTDAEKIDWHKDAGTLSLIKAVLTPAELADFEVTTFGKISWLQKRLEAKILARAQKVISGESFGAESLDQALLIQTRSAQLLARQVAQ